MKRFFLLFILFYASYSNANNNIELTLEQTVQTHHDILFKELMKDVNATDLDTYDNLSRTMDTGYINIKSNFNEILGFNYTRSVRSISIIEGNNFYDSKELYIGTPYLKYLSIKNISSDVDFSSNTLNKDIKEYTFFGFITYSTQSMNSTKLESIVNKIQKFSTETQAVVPSGSKINIHRDYELEEFTVSTEFLYDIAKYDNLNNEQYILPGMVSKKLTSNISIYGTVILGYVQKNYTAIDNYFVDTNGTKQNITYSTKLEKEKLKLNTEDNGIIPTVDKPHFIAQYRGFEYGFKASIQYQIKNITVFATGYQKITKLSNKHKLDEAQENISTDKNNVVTYDKISYKERYLSVGMTYKF